MSKSTKWIIGIVIGLIVLMVALPFVWQAVFPSAYGYGMMGYGRTPVLGYGHMPMMGGSGFGFMPFGALFMWLIPLGLLVLIALGIAALAKYLSNKPR